MTGVPDVKLEMLIDGSWVDLTGTPARLDGRPAQSRLLWSESGGPVTITRGVTEEGGVQPATFDCILENDDGALTPKRATSPYFPHLTRYRKVRFSAFVGGVWRPRFTGHVDSEPLTWGNQPGTDCRVQLTAICPLGLAAMRPLRSVAVEATAAREPLAYWPLTDGEVAAEQSGHARLSPLLLFQYRTGGEAAFAGGVALPTDNVGGVVFTPDSSTGGGVNLRSSVGIDLPASWALSVFPTPAAKDGYLVQVGTDSYSLGIWYDTSTKKFSAIETMLDSSGDPVDYVLSTSTAAWTGGMETMTVTSTTVKLGSSATTGTRHSTDQMLASLVSVGGGMAVESGRARMYSGEVKHLALWPGTVPAGVAADTLTGPAAMLTMSTAAATVLGWAGVDAPVVVLGSDRPVELAKTEGVTAADVLTGFAQGSLSRIFSDGSGQVVVASWDYAPTPVVAPPGEIDPSIQWAADPAGDVTQVVMTWPDGTAYTASEDADWGIAEMPLPGVLSPAAGRSVADWVVASSVGDPRLPDAVYDLLTLESPDALALLDVAGILQVPGLPTQLPASIQVGVVDRIAETFAASAWTREMGTSAESRDRLFIVGDPVRGEVGAGWLAAPLGPATGASGGVWKAGDEVDAAKLNSSGYTGTEMKAGTVSITPTAANTVTSVPVVFPSAFASAPRVVLSPVDDRIGAELKAWSVSEVTTTGFTAYVYRSNTTPTNFVWIAAS